MINLTPHRITIRTAAGEVTFPPGGTVARVVATENVVAHIDPVDDPLGAYAGMGGIGANGDMGYVPVVRRTFGDVTGLPPEGEPCIVSAMVLAAVPGRKGVYAPDTGPTAIRDEKGQIIAVVRLVAA